MQEDNTPEVKPKARVQIVDDNDEIIGYKERGTLTGKDMYRVSALWVTNSEGKILLARRHHTKKHHPNMWGPAAAGTVDEGESYEQNIIKEAEEELGLRDIEPRVGQKIKNEHEYRHFTQWYTLVVDKSESDFVIQEDEVEEVKWFSPEELQKGLEENPEKFLPRMKATFEIFNPPDNRE